MKRAIVLSLLVPMLALAAEPAPATPPTPVAAPSSDGKPAEAPKPAAAANPLANAVQARTPEEQANQSGFQVQASLDNWLGTGTFVNPSLYSYLATNLTVMPVYLLPFFGKKMVISGTFRLTYEYTLPDSETGRRWSFYDIGFGASVPAAFTEKAITGIAFSPSVGVSLPASPESFSAGMIASLRVGVTMSRRAGPFDFRLALGASRGLYTHPFSAVPNPAYVAPGGTPRAEARDAGGNLTVVSRAGEPFSGWSNFNPAFGVTIGGGIQYRATGELMLYAGYTFFHTWKEAATWKVDEFTPQALDANGKPVAGVGYGQGDRTASYFGASYQLNEHYSIDLGVSTIQLPLTPTGQVRFPFLSFGTWAESNTTLYFTLSAAY